MFFGWVPEGGVQVIGRGLRLYNARYYVNKRQFVVATYVFFVVAYFEMVN